MKHKLCLHGPELKHQAQLLNVVKKLLPECKQKVKLKEEYYNDNDMYKYQLTTFTPVKTADWRLQCAWGVLLVSDKLLPVADIILEFDSHNKAAAAATGRLVQQLLGSNIKFVLEEPDFAQRLDQLRGCFDQKQLAAYNADEARSLLYCHLPWQVYYISKLWYGVLERDAEKTMMRQLRVKLRRLRSLLTLCKPLLPLQKATHWQQMLKTRATCLGTVREFDTALLVCSKLQHAPDQDSAVPLLATALQKLREEAAVKALEPLQLNCLTLELAQFLLWIYTAPVKQQTLEDFLTHRFGSWCAKLLAVPQKYPDLRDIEQLHRIRIKLKRFRYALQSIPELAAEPKLLRSLKYLQDTLGLLHDNYINTQLLDRIIASSPQSEELHCEAALYHGWQQARTETAFEALPQYWETFSTLLTAWKEKKLS